MNSDQTRDTLVRIFHEKKKRIVFWYDAEKEFEEMPASIRIDDVTILRLDECGALELKIKLEKNTVVDGVVMLNSECTRSKDRYLLI